LEEIKLQVRSDIADVVARFERKEEEMKARIDRLEAHCINMEDKAKKKEVDVNKIKIETKYEKIKAMMRMKNKINREMEGKVQRLEERVEMWEKKRQDDLEKKMRELTARMDEYEKTVQSKIHEVQVAISTGVRSGLPWRPQVMVCAYQSGWTTASSTIHYDKIISEYKSHDQVAVMDLSNGSFTAGVRGYYTVTFSGRVDIAVGEEADIHIYKNDEMITESDWFTKIPSGGDQLMYVQGSRTMIILLEVNDYIEIRTGKFVAHGVYDFILCVSLTEFYLPRT
jgi:hypothetical protein